MAEGEFALSRQYLEQALQRTTAAHANVLYNLSMAGEHDLYAMLADTAARQRDEAGLRQYAPLAEELAMRYGHVLYQAIAHRARGVAHELAGEYPAAETRLQQALALFQQLGTRWQTGRTLSDLGDLERVRGDAIRARDYFSRALAAFEELEARPDAARARAALKSMNQAWLHHDAHSPDRVGPHGSPSTSTAADAPLTTREMEVLRWLARGLTDAEIAEQLVVSVRTVHAHLRSIYSKLDVTTRSAATRAAIDLKLV